MCQTILQKNLQKYKKEFGHCKVIKANLLKFEKKYGHSSVTQTTKGGWKLRGWMNNQKSRKENNKLSKDKIERLNKIGFSWIAERID